MGLLKQCRFIVGHFNIEKSSILHWFNNRFSKVEMLTVIKHWINIYFSTSTKNNQSDQNPTLNECLLLHGMASTVVGQMHLWLTLEPVLADGLFGQSPDAIQAKFELRKTQTKALSSIIPRHNAKPKQPASLHKLALPPPPKRSVTLARSGPRPLKQQAPSQNPRPFSWSKGLLLGLQRGSAPRRKKLQSS